MAPFYGIHQKKRSPFTRYRSENLRSFCYLVSELKPLLTATLSLVSHQKTPAFQVSLCVSF
ncbi:hypothetical protein HanIR_Chr17g0889401 [Helianthus annuus]|nr:hypothetical protein HanIR_Chr17g0889401 [Helianthus annuus]